MVQDVSINLRTTELLQEARSENHVCTTAKHQENNAFVYCTICDYHVRKITTVCVLMPARSYGCFCAQSTKTNELTKMYKNVVVTSSKSGKLTTYLYTQFLKDALAPYVREKKFLLLIDSWDDQTKLLLSMMIFLWMMKVGICTLRVRST